MVVRYPPGLGAPVSPSPIARELVVKAGRAGRRREDRIAAGRIALTTDGRNILGNGRW